MLQAKNISWPCLIWPTLYIVGHSAKFEDRICSSVMAHFVKLTFDLLASKCHSELITFARRVDTSELDSIGLQQDLQRLLDWSREWQMEFNVEKCKVIHIGTNRN